MPEPTTTESSFIKIPKGKGLYIPFTIFAVIGSAIGIGQKLYSMYQKAKDEAIQHAIDDQKIEARLKKLERWKCTLGWNPPETRKPQGDRSCMDDE